MSTTFPKVSLVIVNDQDLAATCTLLASLSEVTYPNFETVLVDNGVGENYETPFIACPCSSVKVLTNRERLTLEQASEIGIQASSGEYILYLTTSESVPPDFLAPFSRPLAVNAACKNEVMPGTNIVHQGIPKARRGGL